MCQSSANLDSQKLEAKSLFCYIVNYTIRGAIMKQTMHQRPRARIELCDVDSIPDFVADI